MDPSHTGESAHSEPEQSHNSLTAENEASLHALPTTQGWTTDGYPIVDGKYLNLDTGEVMAHNTGEPSTGGPPNITVYWQNRRCNTGGGGDHQFLVTTKTIHSTRSLSEYIIRIGNLLRRAPPGACKVNSLNATPYSVYVVVTSEMAQREFTRTLEEYGLL